jgi:hypothetical protein
MKVMGALARAKLQDSYLGALCIAIMIASALQVLIEATSDVGGTLLTMVLARVLKKAIRPMPMMPNVHLWWDFAWIRAVLAIALLVVAFVFALWLYRAPSADPNR